MRHLHTAVLLLGLLLLGEASYAKDPSAASAVAALAAGHAFVQLAGVPDSEMPLPENQPLMLAPDEGFFPGQITSSLGPRRLSNGDTLNYVPLPTDWKSGWPYFGDSSALVYTPRNLLRMQLGNQDSGRSWSSYDSGSGVYDLVLRYPSGFYWCYAY